MKTRAAYLTAAIMALGYEKQARGGSGVTALFYIMVEAPLHALSGVPGS
jgi:hypothetical protein